MTTTELPQNLRNSAYCIVLAATAMLIHGYHPYSVDAAIYLPAVKKLIDPSLYPRGAEFFLAHAHLSLTSRVVAFSIRVTQLPMDYAILAWHFATITLILAASRRLCEACFHDPKSSLLGAALLAGFLTVPIAGTSLLLADPYLTGRSLSTPALLFSVAAVLEHRLLRALLWVALAVLVHPLMAAYGGVFIVTLFALEYRRPGLLCVLALFVGTLAAIGITWAESHPVPGSYQAAVLTRPYLLLCNWAWYEIAGLVAPLLLFGLLLWLRRNSKDDCLTNCSMATILNGALFLVVAVAMVGTPKLLGIARFQPLRSFHLIYVLMFLLPVNLATRWLLERRPILLGLSLVCLCTVMFIVEGQRYPASPRIEWPWGRSNNPWRQAFDWVRSSTPKDAVFALDPDYMDEPSEDSLGFRAYAERASLADRCTDGGVTAVFPQLAPEWFLQTGDTAKFTAIRDNAQTSRLQQDGATWMVTLVQNSRHFDCPYRNNILAVCRLTPIPAGFAAVPKPVLQHSSPPAGDPGSD